MSEGFFPWLRTRLFGQRTAKLKEEMRGAHWLSYLLVLTQSAAAVLVLGHSELPLLFEGDWTIRAIVVLAVSVLVATVYAADMCLLATLRRIPVLARNRAGFALWEHVLYVLFVLLVEGSTYGIVMSVLDANPQALLSPAPLIPNDGMLFAAQIGLRAVLVCWTTLQLFLVRGKLPPQLTTLLGRGKEIVGGHVEQQLSGLDMSGASLAAAFRLYAAMNKAPRRARRWLNGWLVRLEAHQEAEEERQTGLVVDALHSFERAQRDEAAGPDTTRHDVVPAAGEKKPRKERPAVLKLAMEPRRRRTSQASIEQRIRRALAANPDAGKRKLARLASVSESTALRWKKLIQSEQAA